MPKVTIFIILLCLFISTGSAFAESVSISFKVGDTRFTVIGYSSPSAQVTIMQNNVVMGTTVADSFGNFSKTVQVENPGIQAFAIYALDSLGHESDTVTLSLNIIGNAETQYQNLFLPPTAYLSSANPLPHDSDIVLAGATYPTSTLSALLTGGTIATTSAAVDGSWSLHIPSDSLTSGNYQVTVTSTNGSYVSSSTLPLSFVLLAPQVTASPTSSPQHSLISNPSSVLTPLLTFFFRPNPIPSLSTTPSFFTAYLPKGATKLLKTSLPDILRIWVNSWRSYSKEVVRRSLDNSTSEQLKAPSACDLNQDNICDLTDFSILLYYIDR